MSEIDANGLKISTLPDILDGLEAEFRSIYGQDILLDSNTPDGQLLNIFAQMHLNNLETLQSIYDQMDVTQAVGVQLDQRAALCGISRLGATYTLVNVQLTATQTVSLQGLDSEYWNPDATAYGVRDANGNVYYLVSSVTLDEGETTCLFRSAKLGEIVTPANVIVEQYTVNQYISSVGNSAGAIETGQNEETDSHFRSRVIKSYSVRATSSVDSLWSRISNIDGISGCRVMENVGDYPDIHGIPAHGIWVIVQYIETDALDTSIAEAIYSEIGFGVQQKQGSVSKTLTTLQGLTQTLTWDKAIPEVMNITVTVYPYVGGTTIDEDKLKAYIVENLSFAVGATADISAVVRVASAGLENQGATSVAFIQGATINGGSVAEPLAEQNYFVADVNNITIDYGN